jgi:hypothetical protein
LTVSGSVATLIQIGPFETSVRLLSQTAKICGVPGSGWAG